MLTPGCYGSALFFRAGSEECSKCPNMAGCMDKVRVVQTPVLKMVAGLDVLTKGQKKAPVEAFFRKRWIIPRKPKDASASISRTVERWKKDDVNPYLLKHKINPVTTPGSTRRAMFKFMIEAGVFKPRDVVEELRQHDPDESKASLERLVKETCEALASLNILKKEGRGLYCL